MRPAWNTPLIAMAIALLLATSVMPARAQTPRQKRVLVVYAMRPESPAFAIQERLYRQGLATAVNDVDYFSETLDVQRFGDPAYREAFVDYVRRKYQRRNFDLIIANGPADLALVTEIRPELSPDAPIVFSGVPTRTIPNSTGVWYPIEMKRSLDLALQIQPETRHAFVVCGASDTDKYYETVFRGEVTSLPRGVAITYLCGRPLPTLAETLAHLPEQSIIFYISMAMDELGNNYVVAESAERLAAAANAPIYSWNATFPGIFGGQLLSTEVVTQSTVDLALRVLGGEPADSIPVAEVDASVAQIDWRQLARWNVSERQVPPGVIMQFREPSFFARYRRYIIGAGALIVLQSGLIAGLLIQLKRRRQAEQSLRESERSLRESERHFRMMADTAPVLIWRSGGDSTCDFFNKPWLDFRGRTLEQEQGSGWMEGVHPDDLERCRHGRHASDIPDKLVQKEYRLRRADGEYRWVLDVGVARYDDAGRFAGFIGSAIDITERKRAEESYRASEAALRMSYQQNQDLAGRLINAQEEERTRIARDLHDDVSQQLAGVGIMLSGLRRQFKSGTASDIDKVMASLQERTTALAHAIRHVSHDLHPGVLKHAGLAAAVMHHCAEVQRHHSLTVNVSTPDDLDTLDFRIALCLYRVTQEALTNIVRHARATAASVELARTDAVIDLRVVDDGIGFVATERTPTGLGLRSIDERVRLVGGTVCVQSQPGRGTHLVVQIPLPSAPIDQVKSF